MDFDAGILYYMPQTWTSDNTDSVCRQAGTSLPDYFSEGARFSRARYDFSDEIPNGKILSVENTPPDLNSKITPEVFSAQYGLQFYPNAINIPNFDNSHSI